jgi:hypothetical protein
VQQIRLQKDKQIETQQQKDAQPAAPPTTMPEMSETYDNQDGFVVISILKDGDATRLQEALSDSTQR